MYAWRDQLAPAEEDEGLTQNSREATLRKEVSRLKQALADKTLEPDFFIGALREVKARRQRSADAGFYRSLQEWHRGDEEMVCERALATRTCSQRHTVDYGFRPSSCWL